MLASLLLLTAALDVDCVAPLLTPAPVAGKSLKFLGVMTANGARAPLNAYLPPIGRGYWLCDTDGAPAPRIHAAPIDHFRRFRQIFDQRLSDWPPNCRCGDLIVTGMAQAEALGALYRAYLFDNTRLFDSLPVPPSNTFVRCSDSERTFRSAEAFLQGCLPAQSPNEVIDVTTDTASGSLLRLNPDWFRDARDVRARWTATAEYAALVNATWEAIADFAAVLGVYEESEDAIEAVCDLAAAYYCSGKRLPSSANTTVQRACLEALGNFTFGLLESNATVLGSYIVRELLRPARLFANGTSDAKFALESSHQTAVAAVLVFLSGRGAFVARPPLRSHLAYELWRADGDADYVIRWAINGREVPLRECDGRTQVPLGEFLEKYRDMDRYCLHFD
jgi:acid phosphatase